jgi:transposase-like protein
MKQQRVVVEVEFIEDDLTCPTCESYNVDEQYGCCTCSQCGETWSNEVTRK